MKKVPYLLLGTCTTDCAMEPDLEWHVYQMIGALTKGETDGSGN